VVLSTFSRKVLEHEWIFPLNSGQETVVVEISTSNYPAGGIIHFLKGKFWNASGYFHLIVDRKQR